MAKRKIPDYAATAKGGVVESIDTIIGPDLTMGTGTVGAACEKCHGDLKIITNPEENKGVF